MHSQSHTRFGLTKSPEKAGVEISSRSLKSSSFRDDRNVISELHSLLSFEAHFVPRFACIIGPDGSNAVPPAGMLIWSLL